MTMPFRRWPRASPPSTGASARRTALRCQGDGRAGPEGAGLTLLDAIDPDALAAHVPKSAPEPEQKRAKDAVKEDAAMLFYDPTLRTLLKDVKAAADIRIDTISTDAVVSSGWDAAKAGDYGERRFKTFLDEKQDELVALQILYHRPYAQKRLTYEAVDDLREALKRPPWLLETRRYLARLPAACCRQGPRQPGGDAGRYRHAGPLCYGRDRIAGAAVIAGGRALQSLARPRGKGGANL